MNQDKNNSFFINKAVEKGCGESPNPRIEERFTTLIFSKKDRPFDWYQSKGIALDKSYASRVRRGIIIPPLWLRIKIAHYFGVDSSAIWKPEDIDYENYMQVLKEDKNEGN